MAETGFYVRVKRDGKPQTVDVAELDNRELREFFEREDPAKVCRWAQSLAAWIRDNVSVKSEDPSAS